MIQEFEEAEHESVVKSLQWGIRKLLSRTSLWDIVKGKETRANVVSLYTAKIKDKEKVEKALGEPFMNEIMAVVQFDENRDSKHGTQQDEKNAAAKKKDTKARTRAGEDGEESKKKRRA